MRLSGLRWMSFRLPFRARFSTSRGTCAYREGLILWLRTDSGIVGLGEASPIPEAGAGSLQDALAILDDAGATLIGKELEDIGVSLDELGQDHPALAAVRCALDVAVWDAMARGRGVSVASLLANDIAPSVAVNTTIGAPTTAAARAAAAEARAAGFRGVKLKVGMARGMDDEQERVAAVRDALGSDIALRLDANGAWGVEQAIGTIRALEKHDLELVEQPVRPGDLDGMRRVRESVNTPIAADEDITGLDSAQRVLQAGAAQVLVIKPMVVGGLRPACQIAQLAGTMAASVIVTTTIDAGIATAAALHLAATLPPSGPACGLATGALLAGDLLACPLEVRCGQMELPDGPGLGVEVNERELVQYGSGIERAVP